MAYQVKNEEITIDGFEQGIAPSPHKGTGDMKMMNITTIPNEVSVNYQRTQLNAVPVIGGSIAVTNAIQDVVYTGTALPNGTWVQVTAITGATGFVINHYYFVMQDFGSGANKYTLAATFNGSPITASADGTITFSTVNLAIPVDYAIVQSATYNSYNYYVIDTNGQVWVSGANSVPGAATTATHPLDTTTVWSTVTPSGTNLNKISHTANTSYGIAPFYGTTNAALTNTYLVALSDTGLYYLKNPNAAGTFTSFATPNYTSGQPHIAMLGIDQVMYFCDGPTVGYLYQSTAATPADLATSSTFTLSLTSNSSFILNQGDTATRIAEMPIGGTVGIIVGGLGNNLYTFASAKSTSSVNNSATNILYLPEQNTQYLLQANNYVIIFCGSKGNIYLTNGSSVVPLLSIPDYTSGALTPIHEPYFQWGGAMYLRGRVWFSIVDNGSVSGGGNPSNCGGVWSFVPNFGVFAQQDVGVALRYENKSANEQSSSSFAQYAPVLFSGLETTSQNTHGPQYMGAWTSGAGVTSFDFSSTTPYTGGQPLIETDLIPVGKLLSKKTFRNIQFRLAQALASNESIAINYRTDLNSTFVTAGTVLTESDKLFGLIDRLTFEKVENIQLQIVFTSTASSPSFCRLQAIYLR